MITLQPITKDNWRQAVKLKLSEEQKKFVAPNWYSIIEAIFDDNESRAIYAGDEMVGYAMFGKQHYDSQDHYWIDRLMIAEDHQKKGYGRAAMLAMIDYFKTIPECKTVNISFVPENTVARKLYADLGFEDTGEMIEGEHLYRLTLR